MVNNLIENMRCWADLAERRLTEARARNTGSEPVRLRAITNLSPEPLTDDETAEMIRLLIRLQVWELGEGYRDTALAWLDKRSGWEPMSVSKIH